MSKALHKLDDLLGNEPVHIDRWRSESAEMPVLIPWCYPIDSNTLITGDVTVAPLPEVNCQVCLRKMMWHNRKVLWSSRWYLFKGLVGDIVFTVFEAGCSVLEWLKYDI